MTSRTDLSSVVEALGLVANPQGGWFASTHQAPALDGASGRPAASIINYVLDADAPIAWFHRMRADAVHYFHQGDPLDVVTISPDGELARATLGADLDAGHSFQVTVPGDHWKAFELRATDGGVGWSLISEAVAPAWVPDDHEDATAALYEVDHPALRAEIERYVRP